VRHPFVSGSHETDTAEMPSGKYRPAESAKSLALIGTLHQKSYEAELYQICKGRGMQYQKDQITLGQGFLSSSKIFQIATTWRMKALRKFPK
jgi:hypothetical protein